MKSLNSGGRGQEELEAKVILLFVPGGNDVQCKATDLPIGAIST